MKQYRTTQACYLRMKGVDANPILLEEGLTVGEGTPFDFEGPPSLGMIPITPAAEEAHADMVSQSQGGPPLLKDEAQPQEGGAAPFDSASPDKDSDAEKKAAADKAKAADDKAKADAAKKN